MLRSNSLKNWKQLGLESKFSKLIENLQEKDFHVPATQLYLNELISNLVDEVENISINHLKPRQTVNKNPIFPQTRVVNFSDDECLHGPLDCLHQLHRTKNVSIDFNLGNLATKYERRFMKVASEDIKNLGKSLENFHNLENFTIRCDLIETEKVHNILSPLHAMEHLKKIDFSFCEISSEKSAEHFKSFLSVNESLKSLQLKGNSLDRKFCKIFAQGIENFRGKLKFLGLSHTSTLGNGLCYIIESIKKKNRVDHLEISSCESEFHENSAECFYEIIQMIEVQIGVKIINMNTNFIEAFEIKQEFIKALDKNYNLIEFNCTDCGEFR